MKHRELKTLWKLARIFWIGGFLLWFFETLAFLIYEGWHLKATNPVEIYIDGIVTKSLIFAFQLTTIIGFYYIINLNKQFNK